MSAFDAACPIQVVNNTHTLSDPRGPYQPLPKLNMIHPIRLTITFDASEHARFKSKKGTYLSDGICCIPAAATGGGGGGTFRSFCASPKPECTSTIGANSTATIPRNLLLKFKLGFTKTVIGYRNVAIMNAYQSGGDSFQLNLVSLSQYFVFYIQYFQ